MNDAVIGGAVWLLPSLIVPALVALHTPLSSVIHETGERRCIKCNYPRPQGASVCPECGCAHAATRRWFEARATVEAAVVFGALSFVLIGIVAALPSTIWVRFCARLDPPIGAGMEYFAGVPVACAMILSATAWCAMRSKRPRVGAVTGAVVYLAGSVLLGTFFEHIAGC